MREQAVLLRRRDRQRGLVQDRAAYRALAAVDDRERVEHRGYAGGGKLGVVSQQRRHHRPAHIRSRRDVALEIVRVELDQAGQQEIAVEIERARDARTPVADLGDPAIAAHQMSLYHPVAQDQAYIVEHEVGRHAASALPRTSTRSATASRTSRS